MSPVRPCPSCGTLLDASTPDNACPHCSGLSIDPRGEGNSASEPHVAQVVSAPPGCRPLGNPSLASLADTVGPLPKIRLHDEQASAAGDDTAASESPSSAQSSSAASSSASSSASPPGERYEFAAEIARGGMGAVLRGRDVHLGRDLAVKVLLEDHRDDPDLVRRFIEEAQIGGQLQHPGVVPVYELGAFGDRRPYFTMKLVKGRTLAALLNERASPQTDLPHFLSIYKAIAQTMAYAHARGVIHRDLKPLNVMVGAFGEVQVMDWGLAKVLPRPGDRAPVAAPAAANVSVIKTARSGSDVDVSQAGSVLGTPAYMSPEQAEGDVARVDRRADVFGLGSILCELLTGQPAYVGRSVGELQRKAQRGDLADAFARLDACGADGELISLARSCLAAEPEDRLAGASEVADRITAYLEGVQERLRTAEIARAQETARAEEEAKRRVLADELAQAAQSRAEEAQKRAAAERASRRAVLALAASMLLLTTVGGLGTTWYLQNRAARAASTALVLNEARTLLHQAKAQADDVARWRVARAAVQQAAAALDQGDDVSQQALAELEQEVAAGLAAAQRDQKLLAELIEIRSARGDDQQSVDTVAEYAHAFREAGFAFDKQTAAESGALVKQRPAPVAAAICAALDDWAAVLRDKRHNSDDGKRIADIARAADPDPWTNRLRDALDEPDKDRRLAALRELAESAPFDKLSAISLSLLGDSLLVNDPPLAETVLRTAQERFPHDVWVNYKLALALEKQSRTDESIRFYTAAQAIRPQTAHELAHALEKRGEHDAAISVFRRLNQLNPRNGRHLLCLGRALGKQGKNEESRQTLEKAAEILRTMLRAHPDATHSHNTLAMVLADLGRHEEAIAAYREAIRLDPKHALAQQYLGNLLTKLKKHDEAIAALQEAIRLAPTDVGAHIDLGEAYRNAGDLDRAAAKHREAIRLNPAYANAHRNLGIVLTDQKKYDDAIAALQQAIRLAPELANAHINLGLAYERRGDIDLADAEYHEAIRREPKIVDWRHKVGILLINSKRYDEAVASLQEAVKAIPDSVVLVDALGFAFKQRGDIDDAIEQYRMALRMDAKFTRAVENLGYALVDKGQLDEALKVLNEGIQAQPPSAALHIALGVTYERRGEFEKAAAESRDAIRIDPKNAIAYNSLGFYLSRLRQYDEAIVSLRTAIRLDPKYNLPWLNLKNILVDQNKHDEAIALLKSAIELNPTAAWPKQNLGVALTRQGKYDEAITALQEAIRLEPKNVGAHIDLGDAYRKAGDLDRAVAKHRETIRLDPAHANTHRNLGVVLTDQKKYDEAVAALQEAIRLDPKDPFPHVDLAIVHERRRESDLAAAEYREAIRLDPKYVLAHQNLGNLLSNQGKHDEAVAALQEAIRLEPNNAGAHINLGVAYARREEIDRSIAEYLEAIRLDPNYALAHKNLAFQLKTQRKFEASLAEFRLAAQNAPPNWAFAKQVASEIQLLENRALLMPRLDAVERGEAAPTDTADADALADVAYDDRRYVLATRIMAEALSAAPALADDRANGLRYDAVCCAALAGCGKGIETPPPDDDAKARLRQQARDWLEAELKAWNALLAADSTQRETVNNKLIWWRQDSDLAGIRDEAELAKLPAAEADAWRDLWRRVAITLENSGPPMPPAP